MKTPIGPLSGLRIIEIDAIGPLPLACMMLADLGADIVRVARPPSAGAGAWEDVGGDILHRSRSVTYANLKDPADRDCILELAACADALVEGFRPGVMERLGLGSDECLARNPRLVYGRMTGWGQSGPLAQRAGHDLNYLAITGALHAMGDGKSPPPVPLNLVGDYGGGAMLLIMGLLAAVFAARSTGRGQVVDAAIVDGVPSLMSLFYAWLPKGYWRDAPASNLFDGGAPFYRCYACADGRHVAVGCLEPQFFDQMIKGLGLSDKSYNQNDREAWPKMAKDFEEIFARHPRDHWAALFAETDACVTPVLSMSEASGHPHNEERQTFVSRAGVTQPAPVPRLSGTPASIGPREEVSLQDIVERWRAPDGRNDAPLTQA